MPLSPGATFAGYTIVRLLGTGGMGEVYLAKHPRLSRHDALKILPARLSNDDIYRNRFEREADLAAGLWHPHIVGVHDRGEFDGQLWLSMDYVDGTDAAALRRNRYPDGMPVTDVAEIVAAIAAALDFAHQRGLLHRDVKPANMLLSRAEAGERRILLTDFGIARDVNDDNRLTATNMTLGTLSYCAPEQLAGNQIDGRADQYALASAAYHLLAGAAPFDDPSPAVVISRQLYTPAPPISVARPELAGLDPVFVRALAKDPAERFRSCSDFAAALRSAPYRTEPLPTQRVAPPRNPSPPVEAPLRSNAAAIVAAITAAGVLLVGVLVLLALRVSGPDRTDTAAGLVGAGAPTTAPARRTAPVPTAPRTRATATQSPRMLLPDADEQGFLAGGARCDPGDNAALMVRTAYSTAVICTDHGRQLYYHGARDSDGATIRLSRVVSTATGYAAINDVDPTRYELSHSGLRIVHDGRVVADEPALESAP